MPKDEPDDRRPRQLPLDLARAPGFSRDELVTSPANAQAVALVDAWPEWPARVAVLVGPPGAGKSHLGAIWRERAEAVALDPTRLGAAAVEAASARPVFIDDIDAQPLDQPGLFHLVNAVQAAGTSLLMTARRMPAAWGATLPDLASRLKAAATVTIGAPDDLLLSGVIIKLFADRQVEIDRQVVQYLVRRIERSLATANDLVERLDRAALEQKTRVSRALAASVIGALDEGQAELDL